MLNKQVQSGKAPSGKTIETNYSNNNLINQNLNWFCNRNKLFYYNMSPFQKTLICIIVYTKESLKKPSVFVTVYSHNIIVSIIKINIEMTNLLLLIVCLHLIMNICVNIKIIYRNSVDGESQRPRIRRVSRIRVSV